MKIITRLWNLEAQAWHTGDYIYRTGGSPESVPEENVVEVGDVGALAIRIRQIGSQGREHYE